MMDLALSVPGLVLLLPVFGILTFTVRWQIGSPVFFRQLRPGKTGRPFLLVKFRTMTEAKSESGALKPDAERLTRFGRFMRATSLDELPELWNVIKGEMSLVGPRPLLMEYLPLYSTEQARRHEVRPGITGWAQVNGRNGISWDEKFRLDVWYVDRLSFVLDLKILCRTLFNVVKKEGISANQHATMPKFTGTGHE